MDIIFQRIPQPVFNSLNSKVAHIETSQLIYNFEQVNNSQATGEKMKKCNQSSKYITEKLEWENFSVFHASEVTLHIGQKI